MTPNTQPQRLLEGPARLLTAHIDEASVRSGRGMPGGKSPADRYTETYGQEGIGWDFDTTEHAQANEIKDALHAPEFTLASEAMRNALSYGRYETDDGQDMTGKVQRYTREPDMGNVVVYPDGDFNAQLKKDH